MKAPRDQAGKARPAQLRVEIVSPAEAEQASYVVCMPLGSWTPFLDNLEARCAVCRQPIIHRPDAPRTPPKICVACAIILGATEGQVKH